MKPGREFDKFTDDGWNRLFNGMINALSDPVIVKDEECRFVFLNTSALLALGIEDPLGLTDFDLYPDELANRFMKEEKDLLESGKSRISQEELRWGDKVYFFIVSRTLYRDDAGRAFIVASYKDISEQKRVEAELQHHRQYLEGLVDDKIRELTRVNQELYEVVMRNRDMEQAFTMEQDKLAVLLDGLAFTGIGINIIDKNNTIIFQNRVMTEYFGDATGEPCFLRYRFQETSCSLCPIKEALERGEMASRVIKARNNRFYEVISAPLPDKEEKTVRAIGVYIDVTDKKEAEQTQKDLESRLQRAEKLESIGVLAGGVAHDLNNIMAALVGYPDLILNELPEDSHLREPILTIKDSGLRASAVVQDLLALSREGFKNTTVLNLNVMVKGFIKSLEFNRIRSQYAGVQFAEECSPDLWNMFGSGVHLTKTLMNLVTNAAEALPSSGRVSVMTYNRELIKPLMGYETVPPGRYVVLKVEDTGKGIAADVQEQIFEPFFTRKVLGRSGSGLGLSVVWGTVKDHKGYIDLTSAPGKGTAFELYFPATEEVVEQGAGFLGMKDLTGKGEKILVIDDLADQRMVASRLLSRLGYFVVTCSSGEEGLDYLQKHEVDLVIIDMILEIGIDGLQTYKEIRKQNPAQKAVIVSGYSDVDKMNEIRAMGKVQYLRKPYTIETMGSVVKKELGKG